ncbi:MAG: glycosyltransferase family 1 protein [Bacteroidota bacterium]|nr:glycosyltransferase family 1 protein [Bacteroidota bacterium]
MNIGFDAKRAYLNNTGLGNYSRDTIRILSNFYPSNHYHLFTPKAVKNKRLDFIQSQPNIKVHTPQRILHKSIPSLWRSLSLTHEIEKYNLDIYHGLSHELPIGVQRKKTKTVVSVHDLIAIRFPQFFSALDRYSYVKKSRYACQIADKIIAVSQQTKEDIIRFFEIDERKIEVVYQGCNSVFQKNITDSILKEVRIRYHLPEKYLLYVGTIEERKNLMSLLKTVKQLPDYQLVVIGNGKAYKTQCLKYIEANNMQKQIIFLSHLSLDEMAAVYRQAHLMIYPSFFEGFGIPILEALFSEIPVITTMGGCFSEAGGPNSSYINPSDIEQLKHEIIDISNNVERRNLMIESGKKYANNFTDQNIAKRLFSIYQNML